jgi:hypothetical protein
LRGAPHAYRRDDLAAVAIATAPLSDADAAKRIFDAAKPLKAAGLPVLDALRTVADHQRRIVSKPTVKGEVSSQLTEVLDAPFLRTCRACGTTHIYEMPFRLAALHAGLELEPDTSPPVMRRIKAMRPPRFRNLAHKAPKRFDVIRNYLRYFGPASVRDVVEYVDAAATAIKSQWPDDVMQVTVKGVPAKRADERFVLSADVDAIDDLGSRDTPRTVRLLGSHDPYLQLRGRELLVPDAKRRKELWPTLGRPGAIVADGEVLGTWRPRTARGTLTLQVNRWRRLSKTDHAAIEAEAERLAAHRDLRLARIRPA